MGIRVWIRIGEEGDEEWVREDMWGEKSGKVQNGYFSSFPSNFSRLLTRGNNFA